MILYHATLKRNLESILLHGLDPAFALNRKNPRVWLHTKSRQHWAVAHAQKRHQVSLSEVVIIEVSIPRSRLKRRWRGLWTTHERITAFISTTDAVKLSASPITDNG